jgi:hypothetical protein
MTVSHRIVGYDTATDRRKFALEIPAKRMSAVRRIVSISDDDPNAYDSYELSEAQAQAIASMISSSTLPSDLAFFLECFANRSAQKQPPPQLRKRVKLA